MRTLSLIVVFSFFCFQLGAQQKARLLRSSEVNRIFTKEVKAKLGLDSNIYRAYTYQDKLGKFYLLLSEKTHWTKEGKATKDSISAHCLRQKRKGFERHWNFNAALPDSVDNPKEEYTMFFMTKYLQLKDIDSNGTVDPMLVYATRAMNDFDDGRIIIYIFNKGERIAIKHQNGVLDDERNTRIDKSFYRMPFALQDEVKKYMKWMGEANQAIFPFGWEKAMKKRKTFIKE